ncbi:MAG: hypothetical protein RL417_1398 [Pseudomonadota bacterium]|jgi:hypothetical protein
MGGGGSLSLLPLALPARPADRAFTLQYTTLILIIITFIVGAFGGQKSEPLIREDVPPAVEPPRSEEGSGVRAYRRVPSDIVKIEHLFRPASVELDPAKAAALVTILRSHDIDAEIEVVADSMGDDDYRMALRQARSLMRFLLDSGAPATAFQVLIVESRIPEWAASEIGSLTTIRFYRGGSDESR